MQGKYEMSAVTLRNISKTIHHKKILSRVSFSIRKGETFGLLGPNGAGKTTLMYIVLGLISPDSGTLTAPSKQYINFASPFIRLNGYATIWENLNTFARLYQIPSPQQKINKLLSFFHLKHLVSSNIKTFRLSSGENTKVNICKALLNDPTILCLDEITAALDPVSQQEILSLITKYKKENQMSILYISHNLTEIRTLCDRVGIVTKGSLRYVGKILPLKKLQAYYE